MWTFYICDLLVYNNDTLTYIYFKSPIISGFKSNIVSLSLIITPISSTGRHTNTHIHTYSQTMTNILTDTDWHTHDRHIQSETDTYNRYIEKNTEIDKDIQHTT